MRTKTVAELPLSKEKVSFMVGVLVPAFHIYLALTLTLVSVFEIDRMEIFICPDNVLPAYRVM